MSKPTPKRRGRPFGTFAEGEKKTKQVSIALSPLAREWLSQQPRGWLVNLVEDMARRREKQDTPKKT